MLLVSLNKEGVSVVIAQTNGIMTKDIIEIHKLS